MLSGIAVIGAGFGDEGKGLITDALTRKLSSSLVARFNGGAQAGHTVISGENRHVFGHMSAGTFAGANTYLSSNFIVNPLSLAKELAELSKKILNSQ
jgi:adenylosuccinate synthase